MPPPPKKLGLGLIKAAPPLLSVRVCRSRLRCAQQACAENVATRACALMWHRGLSTYKQKKHPEKLSVLLQIESLLGVFAMALLYVVHLGSWKCRWKTLTGTKHELLRSSAPPGDRESPAESATRWALLLSSSLPPPRRWSVERRLCGGLEFCFPSVTFTGWCLCCIPPPQARIED